MNSRSLRFQLAAIAGLVALVAALTAITSPARDSKSPSIFSPDKGKFRILVNGQEVGKEDFELAPDNGNWVAHGAAEIQTSDGVEHVSGTLELRADGTPARYEWSTQGAKKAASTVTFDGSIATIELRIEGARPYTQQFTFPSPEVAVLDNNLYDQYAVLARLYDWQKKGAQTFSVLIPQELTPGSVVVESMGARDVNGKKLEELEVKTEDLEVELFLEGSRLVRIVSPSSNAEILRQ